jgi:sulfur-carrier protein
VTFRLSSTSPRSFTVRWSPTTVSGVRPTSRIRVHVPPPLREHSGGERELEVEAADVRGALAELERLHPALHRNVCDETGAVRRHIGVFVNRTHVRERAGLETELAPGDVVTILPAVSGG